MISVRLPKELADKINLLSERENLTKSEIIKEALEEYLVKHTDVVSSFDLGKDIFGKYGSEKGDLSIAYKRKVRAKINDKVSH